MKSFIQRSFLVVSILCFTYTGMAQQKVVNTSSISQSHPRILLFEGEEKELIQSIDQDSTWSMLHRAMLKECDRLLAIEPVKRIQIGRRLLDKSREALRRIFMLSYAYRTSRDDRYFKRAEKELLAIAQFSDWNPTHFLDVAEMTMAAAIGYDWLYPNLDAPSRDIIRDAIIKKGLEPSLDNKYNSWLKAEHNWNQVCNAGMTYGAMAIYEHEPSLAKQIIDRAVGSIAIPMGDYGPDGIYPEGYGYWGYGTSFNVLFNSAIEKLYGTDFDLNQLPGFLKTGGFMENMTGPTGKPFNYSDAGSTGGFHPAMFWLANKTMDPSLLWIEKNYLIQANAERLVKDRLLPAIMLWKGKFTAKDIVAPKALTWTGMGKNPISMMRTSWTDSNAIYVATKGGSASINHAHMDIGSFVMDAMGVRWAMDFGMQDYESLESKGVKLWGRTQNSERWNVFRLNNFTHNTLSVDSQLQVVAGHAPIISTGNSVNNMFTVFDLKTVYDRQLTDAKRGISILDQNQVLVRDEYATGAKETKIRWTMLTPALTNITGKNEITLEKDGKKLKLVIDASQGQLQMKTWSTIGPNSYDASNPGTILVGFELTLPANASAFTNVYLLPGSTKKSKKMKKQPLSTWGQ
ncbi:MAG: hypothetical protein RLY85_2325 [Bacteroidota bacterium]